MTPKNYSQNIHTQKNIYFSENPKNIKIQNFEPQKMDGAYIRMYENTRVPPPPPGLLSLIRIYTCSRVGISGTTAKSR